MALIDAIGSLSNGIYAVTRQASGSYDTNGRYTPGATTTFDIVASIQPNTGKELQSLPPSQETDVSITVYTITELKTRTPESEPDIVSYKGKSWKVYTSNQWTAFGNDYWRADASLITNP